MPRNLLNQGTIAQNRSLTNENGLTTLVDGEATQIVSVGGRYETAVNVSMKTNTTEDTTGDENDLILISDNATGKIVKYIQVKNLRPNVNYWTEVSDPSELEFYLYPDGGANFSVLVGKTSPTSTSNKFEVAGSSLFTGTTTFDGGITLKNNGATNGQLLIGNTTGNTLSLANLTAGSNVSITNGAGSITISSTDTNHWTIFDTRKIKPSTSSINYLYLKNTATSNSLNPAIQLSSSNGDSYIYDEYANIALVLEKSVYKLRIKSTGDFEFSKNNIVFLTLNDSKGNGVVQFTNDAGYITASSTDALTNKSGNISQWTNNSNYITAAYITTAENISTSSILGNPTRTFGEINSISIIKGSVVNLQSGLSINRSYRNWCCIGRVLSVNPSFQPLSVLHIENHTDDLNGSDTYMFIVSNHSDYESGILFKVDTGTASGTFKSSTISLTATGSLKLMSNNSVDIWTNSVNVGSFDTNGIVLLKTPTAGRTNFNNTSATNIKCMNSTAWGSFNTAYQQLTFMPPKHTGGPWVQGTYDTTTNSFLMFHYGSTIVMEIDQAGNAFWNKGSWYNSDKRIKTNIENANTDECVNIVKRIHLKKYNYIDILQECGYTDKKVFGWLADDIIADDEISYLGLIKDHPQTFTKSSVDKTENKPSISFDNFKTIDKTGIVSVLWGCCSKLIDRVEILETQIESIKIILENNNII